MRQIACQACSKMIGVPDDLPGNKIRCPHCQTINATDVPMARPVPAQQPAAGQSAPTAQSTGAFAVTTGDETAAGRFARRKRSPLPMLVIAGVVVIGVVGAVVLVAVNKSGDDKPDESSEVAKEKAEKKSEEPGEVRQPNQPPTIAPVADVDLKTGELLTFAADATDPDGDSGALRYTLQGDVPPDAKINPATGQFIWKPGDADQGKTFHVSIRASEAGEAGLSVAAPFVIRVQALSPIDSLVADIRRRGSAVEVVGEPASDPFFGKCRLLKIDGDQFTAYEYASQAALDADSKKLAPDLATMFGQSKTWTAPVRAYKDDRWIVMYTGDEPATLRSLGQQFGSPFAQASAATTVAKVPVPVEVEPPKPEVVQVLLGLHAENNLFKAAEYPAIRRAFAEQFEADHDSQIRAAYGEEYDELSDWLNEHPEIKEEFYNALQPSDDLTAAMSLFAEIYNTFPDDFEQYASLAIATAVTWDAPRAVYDYSRHSTRTASTMPSDLTDALENFRYFLDGEQYMQGRAKFLPWEFLVHLINHKTPRPEREWAVVNYLPKRAGFGACYRDVPYDDVMLQTQSKVCKLNGKDYSLPNIRQFGGVCAMQADYAARVGKSMGVPAAYVRGESIYGDWHAWVMWVELKSVTANSIGFSLESFGRYRGDKYYVGDLLDPQSGQRITDRQLELRLHTVGVNAAAKRHAELIMRTYPTLRSELNLDVDGQLNFLEKVIKLCPWNEAAWTALSQISKNESLDDKQQKKMLAVAKSLFVHFSHFPDFTWTIFDDLIAFEEVPQKRNKLYGDLLAMYVQAARPDLACEARLKLTDHLVADEQQLVAIQGLAATIMAFPDEGRYVPRMLDRLETLCIGIEGAQEELLKFYASFLPIIPQMRGNSPSTYCIKMFERGIEKFKQAGQQQLALGYEAQLAKIRAGQGRKN